MPNFDGTGPRGEGPKTGLGRGDCQDQSDKDVKSSTPRGDMGGGRRNCPRFGRGRSRDGGQRFANRQARDDS